MVVMIRIIVIIITKLLGNVSPGSGVPGSAA